MQNAYIALVMNLMRKNVLKDHLNDLQVNRTEHAGLKWFSSPV